MSTLKRAAVALCVAAALPAAHAGVFSETEPNDSLAGAQLISDPGSLLTVINGARTFNDSSDDFFRLFVAGPTLLQIRATSPTASADSIMGLYNPAGVLVASNDDFGGTSMSGLNFTVLASGLYTIGFSGFNAGLLSCTATVTACYDTNNDFVFDTFVAGGGAGGSTGWNYTLQVAAVPEPETYLLLGLGLALAPWLRKRAAKGASL